MSMKDTAWKVKTIDPVSHEVILEHESGDRVIVTIPVTARTSPDTKLLYLKNYARYQSAKRLTKWYTFKKYWQVFLLPACVAIGYILKGYVR